MKRVDPRHPGLQTLFDPTIPNNPMLFSVLNGRNPGMAVVDDSTNPTQCVLRNHEGWVFRSEHATNESTLDALETLRTERNVLLVSLKSKLRFLPTPHDIVERCAFRCLSVALASPSYFLESRDQYHIRRIDHEIIQCCLWRDRIIGACGSTDNFLVNGLGFCLMRNDQIAAEAYAPFWGDTHAEIGVVTHESFRNRGLATLICAHLIREIEGAGKSAYWSCNKSNPASIAVARKLGFGCPQTYYLFEYEKLT